MGCSSSNTKRSLSPQSTAAKSSPAGGFHTAHSVNPPNAIPALKEPSKNKPPPRSAIPSAIPAVPIPMGAPVTKDPEPSEVDDQNTVAEGKENIPHPPQGNNDPIQDTDITDESDISKLSGRDFYAAKSRPSTTILVDSSETMFRSKFNKTLGQTIVDDRWIEAQKIVSNLVSKVANCDLVFFSDSSISYSGISTSKQAIVLFNDAKNRLKGKC